MSGHSEMSHRQFRFVRLVKMCLPTLKQMERAFRCRNGRAANVTATFWFPDCSQIVQII